ncbi:mechanosensitive ion channel protein 2, chloroplastic-like isoform X3 [Durio zibethinus]|uniref:Mechanosensitive ion channel protein 2, chloroplastic-like isoform X3 n=1 Tax=Durio zibethinus TaxID=66656 RepID=A0A6P5ZF49_DURZI|nr:mechanosensitive ion channel protein 2, chloroplastic-like isoform X3 [Durio zibethinus]
MSLSGYLQLSHDLGLRRNQRYNKKFKSVLGRHKFHLLSNTFSYRGSFLQQDSWRIHLSDSLYRPIHSVPHRNNAFRCHAFQAPGPICELPGVKAASVALTRSYNNLQGSPPVFKLVPAVSIIIFALWGVGPLMRQIRSLLLHKSDNGWKKSRTHYVTTSYIQPLLLWTGAILICRTLDPLVLPTEANQVVKQRLLNFVRSLSTVLAFACCLSSMIQQMQKFFMETSETSDDTRNMGFQFAGKAIYSAVWVAAVSLFMELLGFSTQKWLTAGGLGTVLLTLAGREILVSCFVKTSHFEEYLCVKEAILLDLLRVISYHGARLATPIRTVQKIYSDADLEKMPFADSIYNHVGVPSNRPLLLIEPSYKINGEDRTKGRSSRPAGEQDSKTTVRPIADTKANNKAGATPKPDSKSKGTPSIELKADAKIGESPNSETKEDFKAAFESKTDPKADDKWTMKPPSKSAPKTSSNTAETSSPDQEVPDSISNNLPQNKKVTDKQQNIARHSSKLDNPSVSSPESGIDKAGGLREPFLSKQEGEKLPVPQPPAARPALEENIVLGVALDGSKRTLPIEEGMTSSAADAKEFSSASRNGSGSTTELKKDGQIRSIPSTPDDQ